MISPKSERILAILRQNCKLPTREIGGRLKIPVTTVHNRIKKMEREGVIKGYVAVVDNKKLGKTIRAFVQISVAYSLPSGKTISQQKLAEQLYLMPEIEQCFIITGKSDIIAFVTARDVEELNNFIINRLRKIEGIENTETSIVLSDMADRLPKVTVQSEVF